LVGSVAGPLLDFASLWVQSNSGYDFIVSKTFPPSWCSVHRPVISQPNPIRHMVYSAVDPLEPDGHPVFCHWGCGRENLDPNTCHRKVKIKCTLCNSTCEVKKTDDDARTPHGRKDIIKVAFPPTRALAAWNPPEDPKNPAKDDKSKPGKKKQKARRGRGGVPTQTFHDSRPNTPQPIPVAHTTSSPHDITHPGHQAKRRRLETE